MTTAIPAPRKTRPLWVVGATAALVAAAATEVFGLAARAAGVPMTAGGGDITVGMFAMGTLVCSFWGTLLALGLARWSKRPATQYRRATVALTVLSLAGPLTASAALSTQLVLAVAHLLAAAVVIPVVGRALVSRGRAAAA